MRFTDCARNLRLDIAAPRVVFDAAFILVSEIL